MRIYLLLLCFAPLVAFAQQSGAQTCLERKSADNVYDPLRSKLVLSSVFGTTTFGMMTDQTKATDAEKPIIAAWADVMAECTRADASLLNVPPDAAALSEASVSGVVSLAAKLYSGDLTYAQFNVNRSEMAQRMSLALGQIEQREADRERLGAAQRKAAIEADTAQRRAAIEADAAMRRNMALQYLLGQQPRSTFQPIQPYQIPVNPSVTTNCYRFGNQTTCTTR